MLATLPSPRRPPRRALRVAVSIAIGTIFAMSTSLPASAATGVNGTTDPNFATALGTGFDGPVLAIAEQPNGELIVGGGFTHLNGVDAPGLVRLNNDGTLDTAFELHLGTGFELGNVRSIGIQPDGRIVVGGEFVEYGGTATAGLVRLNADGTLDTGFQSAIGAGVHGDLEAVLVQADGKIVLGGGFSSVDGHQPANLARLNSDGTVDSSFSTNEGGGFDDQVNALAEQPDGSIIVGGKFTTLNGNPDFSLGRVDSAGHPDASFAAHFASGNGQVYSVVVQPEGLILAGGSFTNLGGAAVNYLGRVNPDGSRDLNFDVGTEFDDTIFSLALQSNEYILVGGNYTANDPTGSRLTRVDTNGAVDSAFTTQLAPNFDGAVESIVIEPAGTILVGGEFNPGRLARLGFTAAPPKPTLATTGSANEPSLGAIGGSLLIIGATALLVSRRTVRSRRVRSARV